jgi:uncharacterized OsmC-like protein
VSETAERPFSLALTLHEGYEFAVDFGLEGVPDLTVDEPAPLGAGHGPNPARLLAAAIGNCLGASLLFCLRKSRVPVKGMRIAVDGTMARNERGRFRIGEIHVHLSPDVAPADRERMGRCLDLFEDFCIVTESVRKGVDVLVQVDGLPLPQAQREATAPVSVP